MAEILFLPAAAREIRRLPRMAQETLRAEHLPRLSADPYIGKPLHGPLRGYFSYEFWSESVSYRIAYQILSGGAVILMVSTRDNFYKKLSRRVR